MYPNQTVYTYYRPSSTPYIGTLRPTYRPFGFMDPDSWLRGVCLCSGLSAFGQCIQGGIRNLALVFRRGLDFAPLSHPLRWLPIEKPALGSPRTAKDNGFRQGLVQPQPASFALATIFLVSPSLMSLHPDS